MNWMSVKTPLDMRLDDVAFDCEFRDKTLAAVTLSDKSGNQVRFVLENYSVRAMVPAPPEKKTVHVVAATVRGIGTEIREQFDDLSTATERRRELERADVCESIVVKDEEVEIPF